MQTIKLDTSQDRIITKPTLFSKTKNVLCTNSSLESVPPFYCKDYRIQFLAYFIKQNYSSMLDISCGEDATILKWARWLGLNVVGTNIDQKSIEQNILDGLETYSVDLNRENLRLPFEDNSFDIVVSTEVIEHILNPKKVVDEMVRVSKYLSFITTPVGNSYYSSDHIQHWYTLEDFINQILYDYCEYSIRAIVTKPMDLVLNQRSFILVIYKRNN